MRKLFTLLLVGLLILTSAFPVFADTGIPTPPSEEEMAIQDQIQGQAYADKVNARNKNLRTPTEVWTLEGITRTLVDYTDLKAKHVKTVAAGMTESETQSFSISISSGELVRNVTVEAAYSDSEEVTYSGPSQGETVGTSGKMASHNIYSLVTWGAIKEYKYKVTTPAGQFIRYEYINQVSNAIVIYYCQKANIASPTTYQSGTSNSYRTISNINAFYTKINGQNGSDDVVF